MKSSSVMSHPAGAGAQKLITRRSDGRSGRMRAIFAAWSGVETNIATAPLSFRMCTICSAGSVG